MELCHEVYPVAYIHGTADPGGVSGPNNLGRKIYPFWCVTQHGRHCAGWPSPSCPPAGHKGTQSRMKSSWNVGATELGSCWQRVFRLTAVNVLQIALNCHIEDLGQIPCPKGKKSNPQGHVHRHSASPQQHPRTTALCSLSCNSCFSSWTPNINIEPWVLKFKIECPESIQLKTYINVQWEQKY